MKIGVVFPQTEFGTTDPDLIINYAQVAEAVGFSHILAYDHILGANPNRPGGWRGPYTHESPFYEPFILFSFLASVVRQIEFATGIIILPQRQTALVAKQAATLDVLSKGRLRLGVGLGWNEVEYTALNEDFHRRGQRIEEQVTVLQELWMKPLVNFTGRWHNIPDAGLNPMPLQRPIPIWFGGHADQVLRRVAKMGGGWMPNYRTAADAKPALDALANYVEASGRSMADLGLEARISYGKGDPNLWQKSIAEWQAVGATHITLNTMGLGFTTPFDHIKAITTFAKTIIA